jgi:hypothetical protein
MWILAAVFQGVEEARLALDDVDREIGPADSGQVGALAPTDGEPSRRAIAAVRVPRDLALATREILTRYGGHIVADMDATRAEASPSPVADSPSPVADSPSSPPGR